MRSESPTPETMDEYIASFPADVQKVLQKIRAAIQKAAPDATEAISYQIPTFKLGGKNFIHFAAFKEHAGLYPAPRSVEEFAEELSNYKGSKGTVQFRFGHPVPYGLISRIAKFLAKRTLASAGKVIRKPV